MPAKPAAPAVVPPPPPVRTEPAWLPDYVYTGEKFEAGLAFFADALGRITRFSREPADLALARRLQGQVALPGLVNAHSIGWHRVLRGRLEPAPRSADLASWLSFLDATAARLSPEDVYDASRMAFMEMLLAGITCVGEFDARRLGSGESAPVYSAAILRAAHDLGIRISLLHGPGTAAVATFVADLETLRTGDGARYPADEAWLGVALRADHGLGPDALKAVGAAAHGHRMRLHAETTSGAIAEFARLGIVDKRFTAIHRGDLAEADWTTFAAARLGLCVCPSSAAAHGQAMPEADRFAAAGGGVALGTGEQHQIDLLREARELELNLRARTGRRAALGAEPAKALLQAATAGGARSLGATGGALEVGRPADFFTVNLFEPSLAGSSPETLLEHVMFSLERRAIRDVWIGARPRITNGRHVDHGAIVGRFVDLQTRFWGKRE